MGSYAMCFCICVWFKLGFLILVELYSLAHVRNFQGVCFRQLIQCLLVVVMEFLRGYNFFLPPCAPPQNIVHPVNSSFDV